MVASLIWIVAIWYAADMLQGAAFRVLACFYDSDERSFVELCQRAGYPTDLGGYYIRQLLQSGYIEKVRRGTYAVLPKGKQHLALVFGKARFAIKPRLAVLLVAQQGDNYVIMRRAVQPFVGSAEWLAGEVQAGESLQDAAGRILHSRTGCEGRPELVGMFRRIDLCDGTVFDDKLFAVHTVTIPASQTIAQSTDLGHMLLCKPTEIVSVSRPGKALLDILRFSQSGTQGIEEHSYIITAADLSA